jgi:hypothetical protein
MTTEANSVCAWFRAAAKLSHRTGRVRQVSVPPPPADATAAGAVPRVSLQLARGPEGSRTDKYSLEVMTYAV